MQCGESDGGRKGKDSGQWSDPQTRLPLRARPPAKQGEAAWGTSGQVTQMFADYLREVDIWKMKAEWLVEQRGMVLMITHPDYLCHPRIRGKEKRKKKNYYDGGLGDEGRRQRTGVGGRRSED